MKNTILFLLFVTFLATPYSLKANEAYFCPNENSSGNECSNNVVRMIKNARRSVDIAIGRFDNSEILEAILETNRRGVRFRIILDANKVKEPRFRPTYLKLLENEVPTRLHIKFGVFHHKFAIFDRANLLTGSYNWTNIAGDPGVSADNIAIICSWSVIRPYVNYFYKTWLDAITEGYNGLKVS